MGNCPESKLQGWYFSTSCYKDESLNVTKSNQSVKNYLVTGHLQEGLKNRTVRGGAITLSAQLAKLLIMIGSTAILARLLTPQDFGLLGMVAVITGFIGLFGDLGLSAAIIQQEEVTHEQASVLFWCNTLVGLLLMLLTLSFAPLIAWFYKEPRLWPVARALSSTFLIGGLSIQHKALLKRQMLFFQLSIIELLPMSIGTAVAIVSAFLGAQYWALVFQQLIAQMTVTLLSWLLCSWRPKFILWTQGVAKLLTFGRNLSGFNVFNYFARNADDFLIGRYWGANQLGLYSKAYQLLLFPLQQVNAPVSSVAIPVLSRLVANPEAYRRTYLNLLKNIAMFTMPTVVFMIATSDWIIRLVLGEEWSDASKIFVWLGIAALTQPVSNTVGWLFITQNRTDDLFKWGIVGGFTTLMSFIIGLPFGTTGVAISYATSGLLIRTPLLYWFIGRTGSIHTRDFYEVMTYPFVTAFGIWIAVFCFREFVFFSDNYFVGFCISFVLYSLLMVFSIFRSREFRKSILDILSILGKQTNRSYDK